MSRQITQPAATAVPDVPIGLSRSAPSVPAADSSTTIVLYNIPWQAYELIVENAQNPGTRFTYDRGTLYIMSPSRRHETIKRMINQMIAVVAEEWNLTISGGGSTTHKSERARRGFEPDECYFIANEARMRGRDEWVAGVDPPPDLAVEVDVFHSSDEKLAVYASFKVQELWRWHDDHLEVLTLQPGGTYRRQMASTAMPQADLSLMNTFILRRGSESESALIREFRQLVRNARA